jgi:hypothetical protein
MGPSIRGTRGQVATLWWVDAARASRGGSASSTPKQSAMSPHVAPARDSRQMVLANSRTQRVPKAIAWLKRHFAEPLRLNPLRARLR